MIYRITDFTALKKKEILLKNNFSNRYNHKKAIETSLIYTRSGRQKVIVKAQRKHPECGAYP
jgi:hypothetical protein